MGAMGEVCSCPRPCPRISSSLSGSCQAPGLVTHEICPVLTWAWVDAEGSWCRGRGGGLGSTCGRSNPNQHHSWNGTFFCSWSYRAHPRHSRDPPVVLGAFWTIGRCLLPLHVLF